MRISREDRDGGVPGSLSLSYVNGVLLCAAAVQIDPGNFAVLRRKISGSTDEIPVRIFTSEISADLRRKTLKSAGIPAVFSLGGGNGFAVVLLFRSLRYTMNQNLDA